MLPWLREAYGNAASPYRLGRQAEAAVEAARESVGRLLNARSPREVVFTSGATESNLAAVQSALALQPGKRHIVSTAVEHSSMLGALKQAERLGATVTYLGVDSRGALNLEAFRAALTPETALATAMWANNETGVLFPIAELAEIAKKNRVPFHCDATQAVGKIPVDVQAAGASTLSLSAHKFHGPKGIGALWVSGRSRFQPLVPGSQEGERRGGTANVPAIVGMGRAAELALAGMAEHVARVRTLRDSFEAELAPRLPGVRFNGAEAAPGRLPNTSNFILPGEGIEAEAMLLLLDQAGVCVSTGSACTTGSIAPSHVLMAMGLTEEEARRTLRVSFSGLNAEADAHALAEAIEHAWRKLAR